LPVLAAEQLLSDATPTAVLDAFHRYRLNSVADSDPQSNQAYAIAADAARAATATKERKGISVTKKPGNKRYLLERAKVIWQYVALLQAGGSDYRSLPVWGMGAPIWYNVNWDQTSYPAEWHLIVSSGFSRVHECDRQTDHAQIHLSQ